MQIYGQKYEMNVQRKKKAVIALGHTLGKFIEVAVLNITVTYM